MKVRYLGVIVSLLLVGSCNKTTEQKEKTTTSKTTKVVADESTTFLNKQISSINYQIQAFELGNERSKNAEVKKFISENLAKLNVLLKDFEMDYKEKAGTDVVANDTHKNDLYKLSIADDKDFDNLFPKYYKEFLTLKMSELASEQLKDSKVNGLKDAYGKTLYEHKLFFDLIKNSDSK